MVSLGRPQNPGASGHDGVFRMRPVLSLLALAILGAPAQAQDPAERGRAVLEESAPPATRSRRPATARTSRRRRSARWPAASISTGFRKP
jgi:hypothetical protein